MEAIIEKLTNKGVVVAEQNAQISGGNVAMSGDINQYNSYGEINPSFSQVDFDFEETYPAPVFTNEVFDLLLQKRVLIIKGNNYFDQLSFGRLIAGKLKQKYANFMAFELIQNEENETLIPQLKKEKNERIIILNEIHPRHIEHDFSGLLQIAENQKSFYIIGTESGKETWEKSSSMISHFWYEIPEFDHYDRQELLLWFIKKINEASIPFLPEEAEIFSTTLFGETISLKAIVDKIDTPQKLIIFLNLCRNSNTVFSDKKLSSILKHLNLSQEEIVIKWFNGLKSGQKVVALTAALFNGLFCQQYFEILTKMIASSFWKQSKDSLEALDYHTMDFLDPFFRFETTEEGDLIVARNPTTRVHLLKTAVHQYPRHIEKALEIFSITMKESYSKGNTNWNLHGTTQKRALIRQVFIEATRDIGINALFNIERIYLELAASNKRFIQGVAAKSLAQYRLFDQEELLFGKINNWLSDKSIEQRMELFLNQKSQTKIETVSAIKATTIRILAYAADYDRPNQLHGGIVDYLVSFSQDSNHEVQKAVSQVIPKFIHHHSSQLQNEIFDVLMPNDFYRASISDGLMMAYSNYPEILKDVINHWLFICTKENSKENRRNKPTKRDKVLMAIVDTLCKIEIGADGFSLEELYAMTNELLKIEKRKDVISSILELVARLQTQDFDLAYSNIPRTIQLLTRKRQNEMVHLWFANYLKERERLTGGEFNIRLFEKEFPVWNVMGERPLTRMEEALFDWLNSKSKVAQRFSTLTFLEIAKSFEIQEFEKIMAYRKVQKERRIAQSSDRSFTAEIRKTQGQNMPVGLGLILRLKIFFYLLFEDKNTKQSLKDVIKIFVSESYSKKDLKFVIYKWKSQDRGALSTKLAKWLNRFRSNF